ncbi:hypothetical protein QZH41_007785 [Actinostola sp. cb2023]|nr:hypothetical protein QZH41_007785 [Actinostola sp. cb2023]
MEELQELPSTVEIEVREESSSQSSQSTVPEHEISVWVDGIEQQQQKREILNNAVNNITDGRYSPIKSTLNASWDGASSTQQKKAKEAIKAALLVVTPGQENEMWNAIRMGSLFDDDEPSRRKHFDPNTKLIDELVKAHNQADSWQTKRQILSLFANDFSRAELQEIVPELSKWRIDQARQHGTERGRGQPVEDQPIHRTRIYVVKVDDFIDFISRPDMLQDVAFGTKTLKLDSGERIIIPSVIRTMIPSRIIEQYITYCKEHNFVPAGERSLYRMLQVCSASIQKSLHGLDNITSEGTEAFDNLADVIKTLTDNGAEGQWGQNAQQYLKETKRYLKTDFKIYLGREENSQDHCTVYSLSDTGSIDYSIPCDHDHTTTCERYNQLETTLQEILTTINSVEMTQDQKARVMFQYTECTQAIHAWKAHLLRSINQEEAKQDALAKLDDETCLIVIDWAMKFLPQHYREQMSEFFGKRGRSWHISAVITKKDDKFEVECFTHIFNTCVQNSFAVASVLEHLLQAIKQEYPRIGRAFFALRQCRVLQKWSFATQSPQPKPKNWC